MKYFVNDNAQSNGDHEVHNEFCRFLPQIQSKTALGEHSTCQSALQAARKYYTKVDGCATCSPQCHNS